MPQHEIRRSIGSHRLRVTPGPECSQDGQTAPVEFVGAFDAPDLVGVRRAQFGALPDEPCAAFFLPTAPSRFVQSGLEQVGQRFEVARVVAGVVDHSFGQRPARPVGCLRPFLQMNLQEVFHQIGQSEFSETEQARSQHRVKNGVGHEAKRPPQQPQVVIGAVQDQFPPAQGVQQRHQVQRGQRVDQLIDTRQADLNEAKFFRIRMQAVGLRVEGHPVGRPNPRQP